MRAACAPPGPGGRASGIRRHRLRRGWPPGNLLEREDDLDRIDRSLPRARDGRGNLVMVEGPAGAGKTSLLADARATAEAGAIRVLGSRWAELEREFAFLTLRADGAFHQ